MEKKPITNIIAGLILFLVMVVFTIITTLGKLQSNMMVGWLSYLLVICGIAILVVKYANDMNGNVTFGNLFAYGFKTIAVTAVLFIVFMIVFYMIFPEYKDQMLEIARQKALENAKDADKENIEKGMDMFKKFFWVGLIGGIMISYAILGVIGGVIGAAIAKKNPNPQREK